MLAGVAEEFSVPEQIPQSLSHVAIFLWVTELAEGPKDWSSEASSACSRGDGSVTKAKLIQLEIIPLEYVQIVAPFCLLL